MRVLDLFSGIGGFSLGLERAGMMTVAFCKINPFSRQVLQKHWPNIPIFTDVRNIRNELLLDTSLWGSMRCYLTWKVKVTPRGYLYFQLAPSVLRIDETEFGLLPIPIASDLVGGEKSSTVTIEKGRAIRTSKTTETKYGAKLPQALNDITSFLPTPCATEYRGASKNRFRGSPHFRGAKTSEKLRNTSTDPIYLNPLFAEMMMGFPKGWTDLEP